MATLTKEKPVILTVATDELGRGLVSRALQEADYTVRGISSVRELFQALRQLPPDLIILEARLPDLSNAELVQRLQADPATAAIPLLDLSAAAFDRAMADGVEGDFEPGGTVADLRLLQATVEAMLQVRRLQQELADLRGEDNAHSLQAEEAQHALAALMDYIPSGITIVDATGQIRMTSKYGKELIGRPEARYENISIPEHLTSWGICKANSLTPARPEETPLYRALHFGETTTNEEWCICRPNGQTIITLTNAGPTRDDKGNISGAIISWRDITPLIELRAQLEKSLSDAQAEQALLQEIIRQMPAGVIIVEAPTSRIKAVNERAQQISKAAVYVNSFMGKIVGDPTELRGFHPDGRELQPDEWPSIRSIRRGETVIDEEIEILRRDGSHATILASSTPMRSGAGEITHAVLTIYDITERKRVERELSRLLEVERAGAKDARLLNSIQESTTNWLAYFNPELRFIRINKAFADSLGLKPEELVGQRFTEVFPEVTDVKRFLEQVRDSGKPMEMHEYPRIIHTRPELGIRYFDSTITPIKDEAGAVEGIVLSALDVTDKVHQRERLLEAERARVEAERARAQLAESLNAEISHRVKNNFAMMSGLLQMQMLTHPNPEVAGALNDAIARLRTFAISMTYSTAPRPAKSCWPT